LGRRDGTIYSLGWICHQVSDQFPHRYPTDGFEGFANARKLFSRFYPVDENDYSKPVKSLRNDLISADHWLIEIFADLLCLSEEADFFRSYVIDLDFGDYPEVEELSTKIIKEYHEALYPAVKYFLPLKPRVLKRVFRYYHLVIRAFMDMYFHFYDSLGADGVRRLIDDFNALADLRRMLDFSMQAIRDALHEPVGSWNPEKYKDPDPGAVKNSVYAYESYDGPEPYDFGFRRGFIPWVSGLFLNNLFLNEIAKKVSDKVSVWPVIKPLMEVAARRRRSGVNMTAFFICEMDNLNHPDLHELIRKTAKRFKLAERED
jgi:hypothetical protein